MKNDKLKTTSCPDCNGKGWVWQKGQKVDFFANRPPYRTHKKVCSKCEGTRKIKIKRK